MPSINYVILVGGSKITNTYFITLIYCFQGSCDIHDLCYGKQGRSKETCDKEFYENMKNQCRSENYPLGCWATARAAYIAVKYHANAQSGYDWGQKNPC